MRTILSVIELVSYGTFKYLVEIIQTTLSKNKHRVIDSYAFVEEAKTWEIYQDDALSVPKNVEPKIRIGFRKVNKGISFTCSKNLKNILCQNKTKAST